MFILSDFIVNRWAYTVNDLDVCGSYIHCCNYDKYLEWHHQNRDVQTEGEQTGGAHPFSWSCHCKKQVSQPLCPWAIGKRHQQQCIHNYFKLPCNLSSPQVDYSLYTFSYTQTENYIINCPLKKKYITCCTTMKYWNIQIWNHWKFETCVSAALLVLFYEIKCNFKVFLIIDNRDFGKNCPCHGKLIRNCHL